MSDAPVPKGDAVPTPAVSGIAPVTPGDVSYAVERVSRLPREMVLELALGSLRGDACRVCQALQRGSYPPRLAPAQELHEWHGSDAIRCGVIYGIAGVLAKAARAASIPGQRGCPTCGYGLVGNVCTHCGYVIPSTTNATGGDQ